ncbi:MAG TPA: Na+/H+ antiporter NhaA [Pseudolysinimonas sp.]|jgi:Na+/H+ antiporter NhaA
MTNPSDSDSAADAGRTMWARSLSAQLTRFLRTESGSSGVLLFAIVAALVWANLSNASYNAFWATDLSIRIGDLDLGLDLRAWVGSGLMTLFFLVVGLEARREFDLGELRDRRRLVIPFAAGLVGMAIPVLIFVLVNAGGPGLRGWGVAMSTDTALALGLLTLLGRRLPERLRGFVVTLFIVDDVVALVVIALVYSSNIQWLPLVIAAVAVALFPIMIRFTRLPSPFYVAAGLLAWGSLMFSGVDAVVAGLAIGLVAPAYTPGRDTLEQAAGLFRRFREQPTPQLARSAGAGLIGSISPNERLQSLYHPWTSYLIVPLFALANAGIKIDGRFLAAAYVSPITIGIIVAYVGGKPIAVAGTSWLIAKISRGRLTPPVGWAAVAGAGTIAGVGFTVAVLIATLAFRGEALAQAKLGILSAAVLASLITWILFRVTSALPERVRSRALLGDVEQLVDLTVPVDPARDHIRGPADAAVTIVEYGDFQCPYCGRAEPSVRKLLADVEVRFVWRHLPLSEVHPQAQLAAEASEAAAAQGSFWEVHDAMLAHQDKLEEPDLVALAASLGLDGGRLVDDLRSRRFASRVGDDVRSADASGVAGTPTFFINGQRHYGRYDIDSLKAAVAAAHEAASVKRR